MLASAAMAGVYFIVLPVVWLGVLGPEQLGKDLALVLGPTFAPLLGSFGKAAAIWFIMLNMFHGTMQPLAGAARTLSQLSEDGLLPRFLAWRSTTDCPWAATLLTATAGGHLPDHGRSDMADCGGKLHLSHQRLHAQRGRMAPAP